MTTELSEMARHSVLQQLALAHDRWSEEEQRLAGKDCRIEAEGAHRLALACLKAYRAELDDPDPPEPEV